MATPPVSVAATPPDWPVFVEKVHALLPLLEQSSFDAVARFADLEAWAAGTSLAAALAEIHPAIQGVRFSQAHAALLLLLESRP
jgi:hypothetical protein